MTSSTGNINEFDSESESDNEPPVAEADSGSDSAPDDVADLITFSQDIDGATIIDKATSDTGTHKATSADGTDNVNATVIATVTTSSSANYDALTSVTDNKATDTDNDIATGVAPPCTMVTDNNIATDNDIVTDNTVNATNANTSTSTSSHTATVLTVNDTAAVKPVIADKATDNDTVIADQCHTSCFAAIRTLEISLVDKLCQVVREIVT